MYSAGQKIELAEGGLSLGKRENPYFNREAFSFCSHQHAPNSGESGGPGMTESDRGIYIAWNIFSEYATMGSLHLKETVLHAIERLLPEKMLRTNLPAQGIVTLQKQAAERRLINHWLYAVPVKRGDNIEVVEDIVPLSGIRAEVRAGATSRESIWLRKCRIFLSRRATGLPDTSCLIWSAIRWSFWNGHDRPSKDGRGRNRPPPV